MDQRTRIALAAWALLLAAAVEAGAAPPWKREAEPNAAGRDAYRQGNFDEALQRFEGLSGELGEEDRRRADFNRGASLYRMQRFKEAEQAFDSAAAAGDKRLRADAFYNRGLAQEGNNAAAKAIESYRKALLENPEHEPARINLEKLLRRPPPPPQQQQQQQQQSGQGGAPEEQPRQPGEDQAKQPPEQQQGQQEQEQAAGGEPKNADRRRAAGREGELTQKEADDILRSAEQDNQGARVLPTGKPPQDYDPSRDW